ncbi:MAG: trehalose-phosphatase [Stagnimonas sp.]|nr:trehalose-phosphatase [Stagnimonas sp.]
MPPPTLSGQHALFLDFDGTLVDLAGRPDEVRPDAGLVPLLVEYQQRLDGALAILTGRRLESVDAVLAPLQLAGAGLHGAQRREQAQGPIRELMADTGLAEALRNCAAPCPGLWVEDKGAALAIHYRAAPEQELQALELLRGVVGSANLAIVSGKFVHEARPHGLDKGLALLDFMARPPFAGRIPVFVGDDRTDEDAMRAAQSLGGIAIKVGPGGSRADSRLVDPQAVLLWLLASSARPQLIGA